MQRPPPHSRNNRPPNAVTKKEYFLEEDLAKAKAAVVPPSDPQPSESEVSDVKEKEVEAKEDRNEEESGAAAIDGNEDAKDIEKKPEANKISSLDELYTHCEQLVETLSQARWVTLESAGLFVKFTTLLALLDESSENKGPV